MALPLVADLLETCVNDVIHTPVPMATAGLSASASSLTGEEKVSLAGELTHSHAKAGLTVQHQSCHMFSR